MFKIGSTWAIYGRLEWAYPPKKNKVCYDLFKESGRKSPDLF
jgi:hypothetical protein